MVLLLCVSLLSGRLFGCVVCCGVVLLFVMGFSLFLSCLLGCKGNWVEVFCVICLVCIK